jgi:hypothetical protein
VVRSLLMIVSCCSQESGPFFGIKLCIILLHLRRVDYFDGGST